MARHDLKLIYKVFSLLLRQKGELVHVMAITKVVHLQRILLQFKSLQEVVDGDVSNLNRFFPHI